METFALAGDSKGRRGRYGSIHWSYRVVTAKERESCRRGEGSTLITASRNVRPDHSVDQFNSHNVAAKHNVHRFSDLANDQQSNTSEV